jgi:pimeloyl-ACP methyl ester carboxylesterase
MPTIVHLTKPWLRIDPHRIYAIGGSMGGQEALLLLARHPRLLAGVAAFDAVADFARQYRSFPYLRCNKRCQRTWNGPIGVSLQSLARDEVGGTPTAYPRRYATRSPLASARAIARSCVPLQLWWSRKDRIVRPAGQSARLLTEIRRRNAAAPVEAFVGSWAHTAVFRATSLLPFALARFGLLPEGSGRRPAATRHVESPEKRCALRPQ